MKPKKILLLPTLEALLNRNRTRKNKHFDTSILEPTIRHVEAWMRHNDWTGWQVIDSSQQSLEQTVKSVLQG